MNTAILIHGVLHRSLRFTIDSISTNLIKPLEELGKVDIYYHSWDISEIYNPRGNESNIIINIEDIKKYLPTARGIIEDQNVFDNSINHKSFYTERNPMMQCSKNKEEAMLASMNYLRDAESQARVFNYFNLEKDKQYEYVIVARPDVKYLDKINLSNSKIEANQIIVPSFHSWWGVNDRFAIGSKKTIKTYCYRKDAAQKWLIGGGHYNSEIFLKAYLTGHQINIKLINFKFQRIRANGQVYYLDENLANV